MATARSSSVALVVVGSALAVLTIGPIDAAAQSRAAGPTSSTSVSDPRNDLQTFKKRKLAQPIDQISTEGKTAEGPDIIGVRYDNGPDQLGVTIRFVNLRYAKEISVFARGSGGGPLRLHELRLFRDQGYGIKDSILIDGEEACGAAKVRSNLKTDVVRIHVPRRCLTWPDELRFTTEARRYYEYIQNSEDDSGSAASFHLWQRDTTRESRAVPRG